MSGRAKPNVVLVVLDTVRARNLRLYGYDRDTMPWLDRFAADSTVYADALSPSPWTLPAHASLFTGLYPSQHGVTEIHRFLAPDVPVAAEILASAGYETWGLSANSWISNTFGTSRGFERFFKVWQLAQTEVDLHKADIAGRWAKLGDALRQMGRGRMAANALNGLYRRFLLDRYDYGARRINRRVARWLGERSRSAQGARRPLFLFVNFMEAHLKYWAPARWRGLFLPPGNAGERRAARIDQDPWAHITGGAPKTEEDWTILRALYDGELRYLDDRLKELFGLLQASGLVEGSLVVVTSDHGENIGEHGLMDHQYCLYDTLLRVPLVVRHPDSAGARGTRVAAPVQTHDVFQTILAAAGADLPPGRTDWLSRPLPAGNGQGDSTSAREPPIVAEYLGPEPPIRRLEIRFPGFRGDHLDRGLRCLYSPDGWKYIEASDGRNELYRLKTDPDEATNLVGPEGTRAAALAADLAGWVARLHAREPAAGGEPEMDEEVRKRLESLGYL